MSYIHTIYKSQNRIKLHKARRTKIAQMLGRVLLFLNICQRKSFKATCPVVESKMGGGSDTSNIQTEALKEKATREIYTSASSVKRSRD